MGRARRCDKATNQKGYSQQRDQNCLRHHATITRSAHVAEHLRNTFDTDEWRSEYANKTINEIVVFYSDASDVSERAAVERSAYDSLVGEKTTFSYIPLAEGVLGMREQSHWCQACCRAKGRGLGTMNSLLGVEGCRDGCLWREQECHRRDRSGIAERRIAAQREGVRLAHKLKPGMWFAAEDRAEADVYYIGKGVEIENDSCIYKCIRSDERSVVMAGVRFDRGDVAIAVEWWAKAVGADVEERTFEMWQPSAEDKSKYSIQLADGRTIFIVNATELRMVDDGQTKFCMERVEHEINPVRVTTRIAARGMSRRQPAERVRIPADTENNILSRCWQG